MGILEDREQTHGDFAKVAKMASELRGVLEGNGRWSDVQCEALTMIATKLARIGCGDPDVIDHWEDIAGYAQLVARDLQRQSVAGMSSDDSLNVGETREDAEQAR